MKYIDEVDVSGKKVLIRADFDVPLDETGKIVNDTRVRASLPTIELVLKKGGSVILAAHMGRPKGRDEKLSLRPVRTLLSELLKRDVQFAADCVGPETEALVAALPTGGVLLLENVRYHAEEEKNDPSFAASLAKLCDIYVNNAFATAHRAHASTAAIVENVKVAVGGLTLKNELEYFGKAFDNPARPLVAVFGGAKVSSKIDAIRHVGEKADKIIVGGAMANTFLAARGAVLGKSLIEPDLFETAQKTERDLSVAGCELVLPVDVVSAPTLKSGVPTEVVSPQKMPQDGMALDIGPKSIELFVSKLADAKTIIWNGPMGAFETPEFSEGTYAIVRAIAGSPALTVVGGGDTDLALENCHAAEKMDYVSTAGGAFLCLLEGAKLPAVEALEKKNA
jgi:phosphoglycerate kinase